MEAKKDYIEPKAEYSGYATDVVMVSVLDNITQDKEWSEWTNGEETL